MTIENGWEDKQLITIGGFIFVVRVDGVWHDGKYIETKDFTSEMKTALMIHHADNLKSRVENIGGENNET